MVSPATWCATFSKSLSPVTTSPVLMPMWTDNGCSIFSLDFRAYLSHNPVNFCSGSDGPDGIIFLRPGYPKQGHHRIPGKFLYETAVF